MKRNKPKLIEDELRKRATRAFNEVLDSIEHEPSVVIVAADSENNTGCPTDEITSWLFRRRDNNDGANS